MAIWPFRTSRADRDAQALLETVTAVSRRPAFFGEGRIPDTLEGRFEVMALNGALALIRLRAEPGAEPLAQAFADKLFRHFDAGLREAGVGDLTVPKRMRKLAASFYGRLEAYAQALDGDAEALGLALARNALSNEQHPFAARLAGYAAAARETQAASPLAALFSTNGWPA